MDSETRELARYSNVSTKSFDNEAGFEINVKSYYRLNMFLH